MQTIEEQFQLVLQTFKEMQAIQQTQALDINSITLNMKYIQRDIASINDSVKTQNLTYATKEELKTTRSELTIALDNGLSGIREKISFPIKMLYTVAALAITGIVTAIFKLIFKV